MRNELSATAVADRSGSISQQPPQRLGCCDIANSGPIDVQTLVAMEKVNQSEIARNLGVTRNAVNLVVQGRSRSRRIQEAISSALGLDREQLFGVHPSDR